MELFELLDEVGDDADEELRTPVEIVTCDEFPERLYAERRTWKRIEDVVAVVVDLTASTKLGVNRHAQTSARIYEAATGGAVKVMEAFDPSFVDIQGDGLFGLFHGDRHYERALCAGVSVKTFSENSLVPAIEHRLSGTVPKTGFKVGIAASTLLAKRVGVRGTSEPVWPGKAVNWATKCAQHADRHELVMTQKVWQKFEDNSYVTHSCGCGSSGVPRLLWQVTENDRLPEGARECRLLSSKWCALHGEEFCNAILEGQSRPLYGAA
jgi:class 3 adenylate cyclase